MKRIIALLTATALMVALTAMPASAQPVFTGPVFTGGLVNVTIVDFVDIQDVVVQVPVAVAANVCDVNAAVLIAEIEDTGSAECTAAANSIATL